MKWWVLTVRRAAETYRSKVRPKRLETLAADDLPKGCDVGDGLFVWTSTPRRMVAVGVMKRVGAHGFFDIEYLTRGLNGPLAGELRSRPLLAKAAFLRARAADAVFALGRLPAKELAAACAISNPGTRKLLSTWFGDLPRQPRKRRQPAAPVLTGGRLAGPAGTTYRALATKQPWASLIALGKKKIEYRSWTTNYRGPLVIVASSQPKRPECYEHAINQPCSCLVALVDLVDVRGAPGAYEWILRNPRRLVNVPYTRSRIMTFELEDDVPVRLLK